MMGLTSSRRIDRERPKKTGTGGSCLRRDLGPFARGRRGLIFSDARDLAFNRLSRRGISCRIWQSQNSRRDTRGLWVPRYPGFTTTVLVSTRPVCTWTPTKTSIYHLHRHEANGHPLFHWNVYATMSTNPVRLAIIGYGDWSRASVRRVNSHQTPVLTLLESQILHLGLRTQCYLRALQMQGGGHRWPSNSDAGARCRSIWCRPQSRV